MNSNKTSQISRNFKKVVPVRESLFHNFMIGLQLLEILHATILMLDDLLPISFKVHYIIRKIFIAPKRPNLVKYNYIL